MRIVGFAASNSERSINGKLVGHILHCLSEKFEVQQLDIKDYETDLYSPYRERFLGIPEKVKLFKKEIDEAQGLVISFAEHNGAYTAAYKNLYDWLSLIDRDVWQGKPLFLAAASPGKRGGQNVLHLASSLYKRSESKIIEYSLPSFNTNFSEAGITHAFLRDQLQWKINLFQSWFHAADLQAKET